MSTILQNSIWPNTEGNLGSIKVQIPDGVNTFWPEGDALVHNFVYKDGVLAGFVDTKALTVNDSKSTTINYDYIDIELPFTEGEISITRGERSKYFNVRYNPINDDNVVITFKYKGCKTVDDVIAVDPNYQTIDIVDGMWSEGLGDLEDSEDMFERNTDIIHFKSDLSSLVRGTGMFTGCTNLKSFEANLSKLEWGTTMFYITYLTSFKGDLSSLIYGYNMFTTCKLDKSSVIGIVDCIKNRNTCSQSATGTFDQKATISIGIDKNLKTDTELQEILGISEGATSATMQGHGGATWNLKLSWN